MFGPNALWHSLAGRVSEESGKGQEQQKRERERGIGKERERWESTKKEGHIQKQRHKR